MQWRYLRDLRQARPTLLALSPYRFWLIVAFIIFNFFIALSLFTTQQANLSIYSDLLTPDFYAWVFIFLGVLLMHGLFINSWWLTRNTLLLGLAVKSLFGYALVQLGYEIGWLAVEGVMTLWLMVMTMQFLLYVYFEPEVTNTTNDKSGLK